MANVSHVDMLLSKKELSDTPPSYDKNDEAHLDSHDGSSKRKEQTGQDIELTKMDLKRISTSRRIDLSETTQIIRALAYRLSRSKIVIKPREIFILLKPNEDDILEHAGVLVRWLLNNDTSCNVYLEDTLKECGDKLGLTDIINGSGNVSCSERLKFWNKDVCSGSSGNFDVIIGLGGDGTVLYASWLFQTIVPPVITFSMGSLGFLTKFDFKDYQKTIHVLSSEGMAIRLRMRLEASIFKANQYPDHINMTSHQDIVDQLLLDIENDNSSDQATSSHSCYLTRHVLNDIIVDRGPNATMCTLEVFGNNAHFTTIQADGLCIATPTGSTAYSLSSGGSLCHPENPVILLTAICANTLTFRPIILPDIMTIRVAVPYDARANGWVSFDGRERLELNRGDYIKIRVSSYPFPCITTTRKHEDEWISGITKTLQWNTRKLQKPPPQLP